MSAPSRVSNAPTPLCSSYRIDVIWPQLYGSPDPGEEDGTCPSVPRVNARVSPPPGKEEARWH